MGLYYAFTPKLREKTMNRKYLILTIILFIPMISYGIYNNTANAYTVAVCGYQEDSLCDILRLILQEETKQTALLDHMDCMLYINNVANDKADFYWYDGKHCGQPLNVTGVWTP